MTIRVYIRPFDSAGVYTDLIEVTDDVVFSSVGSLRQKLDGNKYDVGVFTFDYFDLVLNNQTGKYSEETAPNSIFQYKRSDSMVVITHNETQEAICGMAICGEAILDTDKIVFKGFLNDESTTMDAFSQQLSFKVLGIESILENVIVDYGALSNGMTIQNCAYALLNRVEITAFLTIETPNINFEVGNSLVIDDVSPLENLSVRDALAMVLEAGNSVYVTWQDNTTPPWEDYVAVPKIGYIKSRDSNTDLMTVFYGQGSNEGLEDIINIGQLTNGLNRTFNFWQWQSTTLTSQDATSITKFGYRKNSIGNSLITNNTRRQTVLDSLRDSFGNPVREFYLTIPLNLKSINLKLLDKIQVDYPVIYTSEEGNELPYYAMASYGSAYYPIGEYSLQINIEDFYKIMEKEINFRDNTITFKLRGVT